MCLWQHQEAPQMKWGGCFWQEADALASPLLSFHSLLTGGQRWGPRPIPLTVCAGSPSAPRFTSAIRSRCLSLSPSPLGSDSPGPPCLRPTEPPSRTSRPPEGRHFAAWDTRTPTGWSWWGNFLFETFAAATSVLFMYPVKIKFCTNSENVRGSQTLQEKHKRFT